MTYSKEDVARYQANAERARRVAATAITPKMKEDFTKIAAEWERLLEVIAQTLRRE